MQFGVVILAAGASSRMGRPKMLLPWGDSTVLSHLIARWQEAGTTQIGVVCATGDVGINDELDRIHFPHDQRIVNAEPARGMFSSIQCAAKWPGWNSTLTHWAIVLGDQPHLAIETLHALSEFAARESDEICQPSHSGRARHPVFFPRKFFAALATTNEQTLKEFLTAHASDVRRTEVDDPGLDFDLDTPSDYEEAQRRFANNRS